MKPLVRLTIVFILSACACATHHTGDPHNGTPSAEVQTSSGGYPIPDDLKDDVARSSSLGYQIYRIDYFSAIGTDVLLAAIDSMEGANDFSGETNIGGYLTFQKGGDDGAPVPEWQVLFYTADTPPKIAFRVSIPETDIDAATCEILDPPEETFPMLRRLIDARQKAIEFTAPHYQIINPVILPGDVFEEDAILVYLLAGTTEPNVAVMGSHHRVLISGDGTLTCLTYSNEPFEIPFPTDTGDSLRALIVSNTVTDYPLEFHVFASLLYDLPVYVITERGIWRVMDNVITLEENDLQTYFNN